MVVDNPRCRHRPDRREIDTIFNSYLSTSSPFDTQSASDTSDTPEKTTFQKDNTSDRKERRRAQNRRAAATSRAKKRKYQQSLLAQVETLNAEKQQLEEQLACLAQENKRLRLHQTPQQTILRQQPTIAYDATSPSAINTTSNTTTYMTTSATASPASPAASATFVFESAELPHPQQQETKTAMLLALYMVAQACSFVNLALLRCVIIITASKRRAKRRRNFRNHNSSTPTTPFSRHPRFIGSSLALHSATTALRLRWTPSMTLMAKVKAPVTSSFTTSAPCPGPTPRSNESPLAAFENNNHSRADGDRA